MIKNKYQGCRVYRINSIYNSVAQADGVPANWCYFYAEKKLSRPKKRCGWWGYRLLQKCV